MMFPDNDVGSRNISAIQAQISPVGKPRNQQSLLLLPSGRFCFDLENWLGCYRTKEQTQELFFLEALVHRST